MTTRVIFPAFRDEVAPTRYPFTDDSSLQTTDGLYTLPNSLFVDGSIYLAGTVGRVGLSRVVVTTQQVTLWLGDEANTDLASAQLVPTAAVGEVVEFEDSYGRSAGLLVIDPQQVPAFRSWAVREHTFEPGAAELTATVFQPLPATGVTGLVNDLGQLLTGDAWLVGDNGVVIRGDGDTIRFDIVGDPLFLRSLCLPKNLFATPRFVTTINGCPPGQGGNVQLVVGHHQASDAVVRIYPADGGLRIEAAGALVRTSGG